MDNSRRQSSLPGLELSPIGAPMPNSAFSPAWNRYSSSSSSPFVNNIVPDIQRFIAADDTDNDKLRMHDTIQSQATKISELQENLQELEYLRRELELKEDNITRLDLEVKNLKKKNYDLTSRCTILTEEKNDIQAKIDSSNREAEFEASKLKADIEKLQSHLTLAFQAESANKIKYQQLEKDHNSYMQRAENKIKAYEKEIYNFKMQMTDLKHTKSHPHLSLSPSSSLSPLSPSDSPLVSQLQKEVEYYKAMANNGQEAQRTADRLKIELDHSEARLQLLHQSPAFKNHSDREQIIASQRSDIKAYQEQDRKYHIAQAKVRDLQDQAENTALLQEQIRQYKARAERHEELVQKANKLQVELDLLTAEKSKWESFQGGASGFQSPQHMAQSLANLQQEVSLLTSQKGELNTKVHTLEAAQKYDKQTLEELRGELETLRKVNKEHETAISIRDQQITFLSKEKDASKRLLDSYADATTSQGQESQLTQRIKDLEKTVADRDALIRSLEEKITPSQQPTTITKLTQEVMHLKSENAQLTKEVEDNAKLITSMETRLGHGEFDYSKSKILHFTNNPERMKLTTELEAAKTELTTLKIQLEKQQKIEKQLQLQLQQQQTNPSQQQLPSEVAELQQKVFDAEKMNTRLKSVFRSKIDAIKDMIAQLLGYQFEISRDQYTLTSTYAEKETDHFVFRPEGNKMVLVESEYTKQWAKDINVYLYKCKSIPGFLSSVTLEYFNTQTYAG